jgi:hypothetical protein
LAKKMAIMGNGSMGLIITIYGLMVPMEQMDHRPSNYKWIIFVVTATILFKMSRTPHL